VTAQPAEAVGGGLGKFIALKGVTSLCIHGVLLLSFVGRLAGGSVRLEALPLQPY
jgi:hypothetical protein